MFDYLCVLRVEPRASPMQSSPTTEVSLPYKTVLYTICLDF